MRFFLFLLLALPKLALAAEPPVSSAGSAGSFLHVFLMLLVIVACLVLFAWLSRKVLGGKGFGQGGLRLLGGVALGPRERIVLVEAGDQLLVVGIVPGQIRTLHTMPRQDVLPSEPPLEKSPVPPSFRQWLQQFSNPRP
ncbi:MAG: flagellar biosynthetic protein FliO [Zoogloeaceae bacterium]|jgi:flagellar protein FliO/FliZ|nr:flagellar biosynthetic protein FliO [Zoogloeaceae bacterium]